MTIDTNTACTGTNFIFTAAYLGSFDPNNICTNWIGDSGFSPNPDQPFMVNVDNGQTFVVVVSEVGPDSWVSCLYGDDNADVNLRWRWLAYADGATYGDSDRKPDLHTRRVQDL